MLRSNCLVCGNKKNMFISKGSGLLDSLELNKPIPRVLFDLGTPIDPSSII